MAAEAVTTDTKFLGKTFVLTGTLPNLKRTEAAALAAKGGRKGERLGLEKTKLCCGGRRSRAASLRRRRRWGIPVLTEAELLAPSKR